MFRSPTTPPGGHSGSSQRSNATAPVRRPFGSSPFDFERLTGRPAPRSVNSTALSPFPATLAGPEQLHENAATLSPAFATLTDRVKHKSFVCHSYKKQGGWGYPRQIKSQFPVLSPNQARPCRRHALSPSPFLHRLLRNGASPLPTDVAHKKMTDDKSNQGGDRFPLTRWSVLDAARSAYEAERARAMDTLCAAYWKPVYKYVRLRWNRPTADAQDMTQGFFVQVIERRLLEKFAPARSRLRTYLRVCVDSFVMNEDKAAKRLKRGGNASHVALDFAGAEEELGGATMDPASIPSPESLEEFFEKEWIRGLFELAVEDLRKHCEANERERTFRLFEEYDLAGDESISYDKLAAEYGIPVTDVTNALSWARREFRRGALERLREICGSDEEFQREARAVFGWEAK